MQIHKIKRGKIIIIIDTYTCCNVVTLKKKKNKLKIRKKTLSFVSRIREKYVAIEIAEFVLSGTIGLNAEKFAVYLNDSV